MNLLSLTRVSILRTTVLTLILMLAACSADTPNPPTVEASVETPSAPVVNPPANVSGADDLPIIHVPGSPFLLGLISSPGFRLGAEMEDGGKLRLDVPLIWVFSPEGKIVRSVSRSEGLAAFVADFQASDESPGTALTCQQLESSTQKAVEGGEGIDLGCAGGKWVAVLLSSSNEQCTECQEYIGSLVQVAGAHSDQLQATALLLDM